MRTSISSSLLQLKLYNLENIFSRNWETMDEIIIILETIYDAMISLDCTEYVLLSDVIPVLNEITHDLGHISDIKISSSTANLFLDSLGAAVEKYLSELNSKPMYIKCTLLDPRYKTLILNLDSIEKILVELSHECAMNSTIETIAEPALLVEGIVI